MIKVLRKCTTCGLQANTEEDLVLFTKDARGLYGKQNVCLDCSRAKARARQKVHGRKYRLRRSYGLTEEEYDAKMAEYGSCEICGSIHKLCYDHNHSTDEFRGVLCSTCNTGIGLLKDSPDILMAARDYLISRGNYSRIQDIIKEEEVG